MPEARIPQVIIFMLPDGSLRCEAPAGAVRCKIDLSEGAELACIRAALLDQRDAIEAQRAREAQAARQRHNDLLRNVATSHGVALAHRIDPNAWFRIGKNGELAIRNKAASDANIRAALGQDKPTAKRVATLADLSNI